MSNIVISELQTSCAATGDRKGQVRFTVYTSNNPPETAPGVPGLVVITISVFYKNGDYKVGGQYEGENATSPFAVNEFIDGEYYVVAEDHAGDSARADFTINCSGGTTPQGPEPLVLERVTPFAPLPGQDKGRVQLDTKGGTKQIVVSILGVTNSPVALDENGYIEVGNIPPGEHTATITDSSSPAQSLSVTFTIPAALVGGCTDPEATNHDPSAQYDDGSCVYTPAAKVGVFSVPLLNALRFVRPAATNSCTLFEDADNTLFCHQHRPGVQKRQYYQKVQRCDTVPLQVLTNFDAVRCEVRRHRDGQLAKTFQASLVQRLVGTADPLPVTLLDNLDTRTRLVPAGTTDLPANILRAAKVRLNVGGTASTYTVRSQGRDSDTGLAYLVLQRTWDGTPSGPVTATWQLVGPGFNIWEVAVDFATIAEGEYELHLLASDAQLASELAISEPVQVRAEHRNTTLIEYANVDNAAGLAFSTGIKPRIRVESAFHRQSWGGTLSTHRGSNNNLVVLSSIAQRLQKLETVGLPGYLHEKLYLIFRLDAFWLNSRQYQTAEAYEKGDFRTSLGPGSIALEPKNWLRGNGHDTGRPDDPGVLLLNEGYLRIGR